MLAQRNVLFYVQHFVRKPQQVSPTATGSEAFRVPDLGPTPDQLTV